MSDNIIKFEFERPINVKNIITIFYMEFSKDFVFDGERHDFWEMVYIDRGEIICTADERQFVLKGGELTFHKPNEFHAIRSNGTVAPNVSVMTFESNDPSMKHFEEKIIRLSAEEKTLLSMLFREGLSAYEMVDKRNPLLLQLKKIEDAPFGSSQMTKNLLEIFLITLYRNTNVFAKQSRYYYKVNGVSIPLQVKELLDLLQETVYERLTVGEIARRMGKSVSAVKALFASYQSGGMMRYVNYLKIEEAKKLIREGVYNITQISELLRFDTPQYFSITFKRFVKMSPQEYKKSILY